ncbi:hypothetical protein B0J11DRAFT_209207 [Dendryphion nanum]|uniref:Uncharacterized protein n=1 Tax=Dendryphion nanum TaxID=256645 RepID=A0A9P9E3T4_9PLEO|nr:hypothetical protein B0J11DRAFT_209207 [Dendryphion nanum]
MDSPKSVEQGVGASPKVGGTPAQSNLEPILRERRRVGEHSLLHPNTSTTTTTTTSPYLRSLHTHLLHTCPYPHSSIPHSTSRTDWPGWLVSQSPCVHVLPSYRSLLSPGLSRGLPCFRPSSKPPFRSTISSRAGAHPSAMCITRSQSNPLPSLHAPAPAATRGEFGWPGVSGQHVFMRRPKRTSTITLRPGLLNQISRNALSFQTLHPRDVYYCPSIEFSAPSTLRSTYGRQVLQT